MELSPKERVFLRHCISNGFNSVRHYEEINGRPEFIEVDGRVMDLDRFLEIVYHVEDLLDSEGETK